METQEIINELYAEIISVVNYYTSITASMDILMRYQSKMGDPLEYSAEDTVECIKMAHETKEFIMKLIGDLKNKFVIFKFNAVIDTMNTSAQSLCDQIDYTLYVYKMDMVKTASIYKGRDSRSRCRNNGRMVNGTRHIDKNYSNRYDSVRHDVKVVNDIVRPFIKKLPGIVDKIQKEYPQVVLKNKDN